MTDFTSRRLMMVDTQVRPSDVTKFPIIDAMLSVAREDFVPDAARDVAYAGAPVELAPGRVLLEPRNFAKMLEALNVQAGDLVLHVGAGLGYGTAVLAQLAEAVVGLEEDEGLAAEASAALSDANCDNAMVVTGPVCKGYSKNAPYEAILVEGGVEEMPTALLDQLKDGGRIAAIFMDGALGEMRIGTKTSARVSWRMEFNASAPILPGFATEKSFVF
ncbi:MAG: protein-L-isoaspartate O-methyltransferase [Pseudomonadota bacterium]